MRSSDGRIITACQQVLATRRNHPNQSLADLYDPNLMPVDLREAHQSLDKVVDRAFGAPKWVKDDDVARLDLLFADYVKLTR